MELIDTVSRYIESAKSAITARLQEQGSQADTSAEESIPRVAYVTENSCMLYACVIDAQGFYKTFVLVLFERDESGELTHQVQNYTLQEGETLIDTNPPTSKPHAGAEGFVRPRWDGQAWTEGAIPNEVTEWESEHPAPPPMPPTPTEILQEENRLLRAQITAESDRTDFIEDCIAEMAVQVYSV